MMTKMLLHRINGTMRLTTVTAPICSDDHSSAGSVQDVLLISGLNGVMVELVSPFPGAASLSPMSNSRIVKVC